MKLVALSSLILALKMDDAEMTSKFCFHYLINPEKTVKRIKKCSTIVLKSPTRASSVQTSGDFTYKFAFRQAILLGPFRQQAKVATPIKIKGFGFKTPSI